MVDRIKNLAKAIGLLCLVLSLPISATFFVIANAPKKAPQSVMAPSGEATPPSSKSLYKVPKINSLTHRLTIVAADAVLKTAFLPAKSEAVRHHWNKPAQVSNIYSVRHYGLGTNEASPFERYFQIRRGWEVLDDFYSLNRNKILGTIVNEAYRNKIISTAEFIRNVKIQKHIIHLILVSGVTDIDNTSVFPSNMVKLCAEKVLGSSKYDNILLSFSRGCNFIFYLSVALKEGADDFKDDFEEMFQKVTFILESPADRTVMDTRKSTGGRNLEQKKYFDRAVEVRIVTKSIPQHFANVNSIGSLPKGRFE